MKEDYSIHNYTLDINYNGDKLFMNDWMNDYYYYRNRNKKKQNQLT